MPTMLNVNQWISDYCQTSFNSNSKEDDGSDARISRDNSDCDKFYNCFFAHDPFPESEVVKNIHGKNLFMKNYRIIRKLRI